MSVLQEGRGEAARQVYALPMERVFPNPRQPRKEFDEYALLELASSIRQHGLLQPITVRAAGGGYEIIMGERRYRACRLLGFSQIDAFVAAVGEEESALLALIENLQRENLHFFEEADAYAQLVGRGMTQESLARRLGKSASGIANKIRLLKIEPDLRAYIMEEGLTERHARALLALPPGASRSRVARQAAQGKLSVRETEALVARAQKRLPTPPPQRKVISMVHDYRLYTNAIRSVVLQMQETGLEASLEEREGPGWADLRVRIGAAAQETLENK